MKRPSPFFHSHARVAAQNMEDFMDSGSDSGLDVIDQRSLSSTWEHSNGPLEVDSSFSSPPIFKVPRLSISHPNEHSIVSSENESQFNNNNNPAITTQESKAKECQELARLQSVLKALLRDASNESTAKTIDSTRAEIAVKCSPKNQPRNGPIQKGSAALLVKLESNNDNMVTSSTAATLLNRPNNNSVELNKLIGARGSGGKVLTGHQANGRRPKTFSLYTSFPNKSQNGSVELKILSEPEEQHRARYMTEGSRGAVKDRSGAGYPIVKLFGYDKPVTLQIFIGNDQGKTVPHLFYQASKACGKNSPPCRQRKLQGTVVIELELNPDKEMTESCDCVGILKERNVDVEQRMVHFGGTKTSKKRSPRCRLVFRVCVTVNGQNETLQVASHPILCTQPPGIPEISRQSLTSCSANGGVELFLIGKNFLKDSRVVFRDILSKSGSDYSDSEDSLSSYGPSTPTWQEIVLPDKDFLQPTHLICTVPAYKSSTTLTSGVKVEVLVQSSGKRSEAQYLTFYPEANLSVFGKDNHTIVQDVSNSPTSTTTVIQFPNLVPKKEQMDFSNVAKTSLPAGQIFVVLPATTTNNHNMQAATTNNNFTWKTEEQTILPATRDQQHPQISVVMMSSSCNNTSSNTNPLLLDESNSIRMPLLAPVQIQTETSQQQQQQLQLQQTNNAISAEVNSAQLALEQINQEICQLQSIVENANAANAAVASAETTLPTQQTNVNNILNQFANETSTLNNNIALIPENRNLFRDSTILTSAAERNRNDLNCFANAMTNAMQCQVVFPQTTSNNIAVAVNSTTSSAVASALEGNDLNRNNNNNVEALVGAISDYVSNSSMVTNNNGTEATTNATNDIVAAAGIGNRSLLDSVEAAMNSGHKNGDLQDQQSFGLNTSTMNAVALEKAIETCHKQQEMINELILQNSNDISNQSFMNAIPMKQIRSTVESLDSSQTLICAESLLTAPAPMDVPRTVHLQHPTSNSGGKMLNLKNGDSSTSNIASACATTISSLSSSLRGNQLSQQQIICQQQDQQLRVGGNQLSQQQNQHDFTQKQLNLFNQAVEAAAASAASNSGVLPAPVIGSTPIEDMSSSMMALLPDAEILNLINNHTFG